MTDDRVQAHFGAASRCSHKWRHYFPIYDRLLAPYRGHPVTIVEVGVADGGSLQAWRSYLGPAARIIGIDIDPAALRLQVEGFEIIIGDQSRPEFWEQHLPGIGPIDVLIDDGGHRSAEQIVTVGAALPQVRDGGVIVVEDTHTSYLPKQYPAHPRFGFMQFAQHAIDVLHERNHLGSTVVTDTAGLGRAIHSVQFFEAMVVFHVDRRLCGPTELFEAGSEALPPSAPTPKTIGEQGAALLEAQPSWLQLVVEPARRLAGILRREMRSYGAAGRVRRYFR